MNDVEKEQELRSIYYDPISGYQSRERLYQKARESGLKVSRREVNEWLETQDTYTMHKPVRKRHKFQKTYVNDLADQIQLDLVDLSKFSHKNQGYRWILTGIEILSRYALAFPVQRKDTAHMTEAVTNLLEEFKIGFGKYPNVVQFDDGKEFYNVGVKRLLKGKEIKYFSTKSNKKAAIVERFNRTLKTMMWKYFFKNKTYNWLNVLDQLVDNYNDTKHRSIQPRSQGFSSTLLPSLEGNPGIGWSRDPPDVICLKGGQSVAIGNTRCFCLVYKTPLRGVNTKVLI